VSESRQNPASTKRSSGVIWRPTGRHSLSPRARERGEGRGEGQKVETLRGKNHKRAERARLLRRSLTRAEFELWTRLRGRQLGGLKFVRQQSIARYYVDFVCRERRLIIELDGGQHAENAEDRERDRTLCALGYRVIRIWNNDVIDNLDGVLQTLVSELERQPLTPALSPQAGRGR
jgi:very-short-patch-repair endonuclease